ncbi:PREDICTED: uncharacterized protein LOC100640592 [Amphimedon queenslandica]|uniref:Uncharacterized protein n=2 Tax=Amphimedon queenslandica TaxID=400682 RepID=A0AAN0JMG4_AMPQE|nr:PREDICTED: uncharacterized protein LOC100640592 [Amphimedon queenslandica]|eukprot:XP_019858199.1 PREDICTED: uncharacterized protein LOC100640592 [Amphimedon queenslandica]
MFPKDFIFYFDLAYTNYCNESVDKNAHLVMIHYLHELKKVQIETVAEQVEHFVKLGDFRSEMLGMGDKPKPSNVFELTAKSFLRHCELYFKGGEISELFHVTLLSISIVVKIGNFSDKKLAKKHERIWTKRFNEYYKSGFNQVELRCLEEGLKAMTIILEDSPHLMAGWKDFYVIFSSKVQTFEIMREFIARSVKYLIQSGEDGSFRIDFLQPLTQMCLIVSQKKRAANNFSVKTNNVINEGKEFLTCLILLINEQKWESYYYNTILENWMKIIFNLIDLSDKSHNAQLYEWIGEERIESNFDYQSCFNKKLKDLLSGSHNLSAETLLNIIYLMPDEQFNKASIISEFLGKSVPKSLLEEPNCQFIILAVNIASDADYLISYFKTVMEVYTKSHRQLDFFIDLMSLNLQPSKKIESDFMKFLKNYVSSPVLLAQLKDNPGRLFSNDLTFYNSLNLLILKQILKKSLEILGRNVILASIKDSFNNVNIENVSFSSTGIRAALFIVHSELQDVEFTNFSCYREHSSTLVFFSLSFRTIWTAFIKKNKNFSLSDFEIDIADIPEIQPAIETIHSLKNLVSVTTSHVRERTITYINLEEIKSGYEAYDSIYNCISSVYRGVEIGEKISKEEIEKCLSEYDCLVCKIENLLVTKPKNLPSLARLTVKSVLQSYGITFPDDLNAELLSSVAQSSSHLIDDISSFESEESQEFVVVKYRAATGCTLATIEAFAEHLQIFLQPLNESINVLAFNILHKSQILKKCIEHFLIGSNDSDSTETKMKKLNEAVKKANCFVELLMDDPGHILSMKDVTSIFKPEHLAALDIPKENKELCQFYKLKYGYQLHIDVTEKLTIFLELDYVCKQVNSLHNVCCNYGLINSFNDPVMHYLLQLSYNVTEGKSVNYAKAKRHVCFIKTTFDIKERTSLIDHPFFALFSHLEKGCPLYIFASERGYGSEAGMETFMQEHSLVTTGLLFEEFHKDVLVMLIAAMKLIIPFFDKTCDLVDLWDNMQKLGNVEAAIAQLLTVNGSIDYVRSWFNQANGEAQENNKKILQAILSSGYYYFNFCEGSQVELTLKFQMHCSISKQQRPEEQQSLPVYKPSARVLSFKQLQTLSQELDFMTCKPDSEVERNMRWFELYKIFATKLHACYSDLQYSGHPDYKNPPTKQFTLFETQGNVSWTALEAEVKKCNKEREEFVKDMVLYRKKYQLLSYINTLKLKVIYDSLIGLKDIDNLLRDVGLFLNLDVNSHPQLYKCLEGLQKKYDSDEVKKLWHPARLVGEFLNEFISLSSVQPHLLDFMKLMDLSTFSLTGLGDLVTFSLISALSCSHLDLLRLIYWTFNESFPTFHQLFRCSGRTKKEDIELFFDRVKQCYSIDKYLVLGVNLISNDLQQIFLENCSSLKTTVTSEHHNRRLSIYLVEYSSSLFQHIPWISQSNIATIDNLPNFDSMIEQIQSCNIGTIFKNFEVVYGQHGSGKSYYIRDCIKKHRENHSAGNNSANYVKILSINETFNKIRFVRRFRNDSLNTVDVLIYLNINLVWPQSKNYQALFDELVDEINWFFFEYFILHYVEVIEYKSSDGSTCTSPECLSLILTKGTSLSVYVEAPFWDIPLIQEAIDHRISIENSNDFSDTSSSPFSLDNTVASVDEESLRRSVKKFDEIFPVFALLGKKTQPPSLYDVSSSGVQLVCKYLKGYHDKNLDHLMKRNNKIIKIDRIIGEVKPDKCHKLIGQHLPSTVSGNQLMTTIYLKYMERRCRFMEDSVFFQNNVGLPYPVVDDDGKKIGEFNTSKLRSNVFDIMLHEVPNFCKLSMSGSSKCHTQLIYDVRNGGGTFKLFCSNPEELSDKKLEQLKSIGIVIPPDRIRLSTKMFHEYLSFALNVRKDEKGEIALIKTKKCVLTSDFVHKLLNIHERKGCGMPVVIEGETGVGSTFLLELLSSLWNHSWNEQLTLQRSRFKIFFKNKLSLLQKKGSFDESQKKVLKDAFFLFTEHKKIETNMKSALNIISDLLKFQDPSSSSATLLTALKSQFKVNMYDPVIASLEIPHELCKKGREFSELLTYAQTTCDENTMAEIVCGILYGRLRETFYKINIHSAITAKEVEDFFCTVQKHAESLISYYEAFIKHSPELKTLYRKPILTVFLNEINTSCCPGFMKEIIIDGMIDGRSISTSGNIFIVAACKPHQANSLAVVTKSGKKRWFNPTYYVQNLPPSLKLIRWDYGQLQKRDEEEYIKEKLRLECEDMPQLEYTFLAQQIAKAQELIRSFACENLMLEGINEEDAKLFAQSTVSQRDIKRVFQLYSYLKKWFTCDTKYGHESEFRISVRAVFISLALVYYFRLSDEIIKSQKTVQPGGKEKKSFRKRFKQIMHEKRTIGEFSIPVTFNEALSNELTWVSKNIDLPKGIAPTEALRENIYAIIVCTMTKIPVIIVGPTGSSKTLSFKIVAKNFLGTKSNKKMLETFESFKSLDPQFYQYSRKSTSHEIEVVFQRAISRQKAFDEGEIKSLSVVLMDEADIPEYTHESLKVLHCFLDDPKVSFVGLFNTVPDATITNRAISVYRTEASHEDLLQLARFSFCHGQPDERINDNMSIIEGFIKIYEQMMNLPVYNSFFGLRDFICFFTALNTTGQQIISPQSVVMALEQNFSGTNKFDELLKAFLGIIGSNPSQLQKRSLIDILRTSFIQKSRDLNSENKNRYKLLIDSSEDQSLVRQLFNFGILKRNETRILSCSKLPGDNDSQKLYTASAIRHSVTQGHTVMIYQAEEIQECFYDLFNQHFTCINSTINDGEKSYYCNVAIGPVIKPTCVSPFFNCAMIIRESEVSQTERPFLNRFEKFSLTHKVLLKESLSKHSQSIRNFFDCMRNNIMSFVQKCNESSFYGFTNQNIDSLLLSIISLSEEETDSNCPLIKQEFYECRRKLLSDEVDSNEKHQCQCNTDVGVFVRQIVDCFSNKYRITLSLGHCEEFSELIEHLNHCEEEWFKAFFKQSNAKEREIRVKRDVEYLNEAIISFNEPENFVYHLLSKLMTIHLIKQLLYLMTPEALVMHSGKIENYYKSCYLIHQHHFSLSNIIKCQMEESKNVQVVKKFLCYTRTSPVLLELIPAHFYIKSRTEEEEKDQQLLAEFFEMNSDQIYTYIITKLTSQEKLNTILNHFFLSSCTILLLSADMNELHKDTINHTRLLIEEAELTRKELNANKLIFLILHFPTNMFYSHCYPSIFLSGWRHIYMDMIGQTKTTTNTNVEEWLKICLLRKNTTKTVKTKSFVPDSILNLWIEEWLPMIANSIPIQYINDFSSEADAKNCWKNLLIDLKVDSVIKKRFNSYWQKSTMYELSHHAANYVVTYHSTCSLSSTIEATIQSSFKNFVLYFLFMINQNMAMHTVMGQGDGESFVDPFLKILSVLPLPKSLEEIRLELTVLNYPVLLSFDRKNIVPHFPFFPVVYKSIEALVNKALCSVLEPLELAVAEDETEQKLEGVTLTGTKKKIEETVKMIAILIKEDDSIIKVVVELLKYAQLWAAYFNDAIRKQLDRTVGIFSRNCLQQHLAHVNSDNVPLKLAQLHYHLRVSWLDADSLSLLRILDECSEIMPKHSSLKQKLDLTDKTLVVQHIIEILYDGLLILCSNPSSESKLKMKNLGSLFYRMMSLFKLHSTSVFSSQLKSKWIILCVAFLVNHMITIDSKNIFAISPENFVTEITKSLKAAIDSGNIIDLTVLIDTVVVITFKKENVLNLLHDQTYYPTLPFYSIIETIINHYITFYYDDITLETMAYIFSIIGLVVSKCTSERMKRTAAMYKHMFSLLLLKGSINSNAKLEASVKMDDENNPLLLFTNKVRNGLCYAINQGSKKEFYRVAYFKCCPKMISQSKGLLQHVLCDMYFETSLDRLYGESHKFKELMAHYQKLNGCTTGPLSTIVDVERQVVVHVTIKSLSITILKTENERQVLADAYDGLNSMLEESNNLVMKGKKDLTGNGLILLMRLFCACKSERILFSMMTTQFQSNLHDYHCLQPIHKVLSLENLSFPDELPLLLYFKNKHSSRHAIYTQIHRSIVSIIKFNGQKGVDDLMKVALSCYSNKTSTDKTKWTFNMSIFIAIYKEVFPTNPRAAVVKRVLQDSVSQYVDKDLFLPFLMWIVDPSNAGTPSDRLKDFFVKSEGDKEHVECLIELAAILFGNEENCCHLWEHLFSAQNINPTFVPGTMETGSIDTYYFDVVLPTNQTFRFTKRKSLTRYSLIFTQWMNYGLLCFLIAVKPHIIKSSPFDQKPNIVLLCLKRLKDLWDMLMTEFNLSREERKRLVSIGIQNMYTALSTFRFDKTWRTLKQLPDKDSLAQYECIFHNEVFLQAWRLMKSPQIKFSTFGSTVGEVMRELSRSVPELNICPAKNGFLYCILFSNNLYNVDSKLYVLYQFLLRRPALNAGAHLLPVLIDLYNWIHSQTCYMVTLDVAKSTSTFKVLTSILQQHFPDQEEKRLGQLHQIKEMYDHYTMLSLTEESSLETFSTEITFHDMVSTDYAKGILYRIIIQIVDSYNRFLEIVYTHFSTSYHFVNYKPQFKIPIWEITQHTCSFGVSKNCYDVSDLQTIIENYQSFDVNINLYDNYELDPSIPYNVMPGVYFLEGIQSEVVQKFIVHKQFVEKNGFLKRFAFSECSTCEEVSRELFYTATYGYKDTVERLSRYPSLMATLTKMELHEIETVFHSLSYDGLLSVCGGLCLLLKMLLEKSSQGETGIDKLTIKSFLNNYYKIKIDDIGILLCAADKIRSGLLMNQYNYLSETHVAHVKDISELFHEWVKIGFYDFSHLPFDLKVNLNQKEEILEKIENEDEETVKNAIHQLFAMERLICYKATDDRSTKICDVNKERKLNSYIFSLSIKYYVHLQLALRRRLLHLLETRQKEQHNVTMKQKVDNAIIDSPPSPNFTSLSRILSIQDRAAEDAVVEELTISTDSNTAGAFAPNPAMPKQHPSSYMIEDEDLSEAASKLTETDVAQLLKRMGLHDSAEFVQTTGISGDIVYSLLTMPSPDLKELQIPNRIYELRFQVQFKRLLEKKELEHVFSSELLAQFLMENKRFSQYAKVVRENELDGEMLLLASDDVYRDLGISSLYQALIKKELQKKLKDF